MAYNGIGLLFSRRLNFMLESNATTSYDLLRVGEVAEGIWASDSELSIHCYTCWTRELMPAFPRYNPFLPFKQDPMGNKDIKRFFIPLGI